jgi:hypothetical protein
MGNFEVRGMEKFEKVAKALKQAGDKELRKELYSALNRATKPMRANAKKAARRQLPQAGGLNKRVAAARLSTKGRIVKGDPRVEVVAKGLEQLAMTDQGMVRHPAFGDRGRWVNQPIPEAEGWFTNAMLDGKQDAQREIIHALDDVAKKLAKKY